MSNTRSDDALAPLITPPSQHEAPASTQQRRQDRPRSPYLLILTASLSGLLFGFDTGIISSTLLYLPGSFAVSTLSKSLIASATALLALVASPAAGPLADALGRRPVILGACALFVAGALVQAGAPGVGVMVLGRALVGVAIGAASGVVPLYIAEMAPARERGRLVTVQSLFITGGQVLAYLVGWACAGRWRVAVGLGAVPAVLQGCLMGGLVESPRWLVLRGREGEARRVLEGLGVEGDAVVRRIKEEIKVEGGEGSRWRELVGTAGNRRALTIACMLQGLQQLCGFNVLMYFSASIFSWVGFKNPVTASLSVALTNFIFTLVTFSLIDTIGRRRILLISIPFMVFGIALCSVCFAFLPSMSAGDGVPQALAARNMPFSPLSAGALLSLILYVAAYALGLGCVPWQQSELFPLRVRSLGSGLATATNWSSNFIVGITFLPMMDAFGSSLTFALYGCICFVGWFLVYGYYPETAGLELEDVGKMLAHGWGVKESVSRRSDRGGYGPAPTREEVDDPS